MKIEEIIARFEEKERKEIVGTIECCMEAICCEKVNWKTFEVYEKSVDTMEKVLKNLAIEFLLPIAERVREEDYIEEVLIICSTTNSKTDEIGCIKFTPSQLYATIRLSPKTRKALELKS